MRKTKLVAVLASFAISSGAAAVLAAAPAQADTPTQVRVDLGGYGSLTVLYGSYLGTFSTQISDGTDPVTVGAATLQQKLPGKSWKDVKTDGDVSDGVSFGQYGSRAKENVQYRVHYLGGTDTDTATTYSPSFSNNVVVRTAWDLHPKALCQARCRFYGTLSPRASHHKVLIQVKHHGWKRYRVVHTNSRSHWTVYVKPSRGAGTYYRAVVAGTQRLIGNYAIGHFTITGRSAYAVSQR
jgi:hypothetical protein